MKGCQYPVKGGNTMKISVFRIALFAFVAIFFSVHISYAFLANPVSKVVRETIEYTAKKFGIELSKDAGKVFAEKAAQFIAKHGDDGARLLRHAGPEIMELSVKHGDDIVRMCASHSDNAISFLIKNADDALPLWRQFGKEGTEMMIKHPGLGERAIKEFGSEGITLANRFSSESLNKALVLSSKAASQAEKRTLFDTIMRRGDDVIEFLWKHKWKIGAGATVYTLLKDFEGLPVDETAKSSGRQNLLQWIMSRAINKVLDEYPWIILVFIGFIIMWLYPLLKWIWNLRNYFSSNKKAYTGESGKAAPEVIIRRELL